MATTLLAFKCYHSDMERKPSRRCTVINSAAASITLSLEGTKNLLSKMELMPGVNIVCRLSQ